MMVFGNYRAASQTFPGEFGEVKKHVNRVVHKGKKSALHLSLLKDGLQFIGGHNLKQVLDQILRMSRMISLYSPIHNDLI